MRKKLCALLTALAACEDTPTAPVVEKPPTVVVWASTRDGNLELYAMNPVGTDLAGRPAPRRLTNSPGVDGAPDLSVDGRKIAFHSIRGDHSNLEIYAMDVDGGNPLRLTSGGTLASSFPAWSPDGKQIALSRGTAPERTTRGDRQIWVMNSDGTGLKQLTTEGDNYRPKWSPDGTRIVFASDRDGDFANAAAREKSAGFGLHDIYLMNSNGTGVQRLTTGRTYLNGEPTFSPNGKQIAFRSRRDTDASGTNYCAVWVMNADGGQPRNLTPIPAGVTSEQWCNAYPNWSTDGKHIVFHANRPTTEFGLQLEVYSVNTSSGAEERLTYSPTPDLGPVTR